MIGSKSGGRVFCTATAGLAVLGVGSALPGKPLSTEELLGQVARQFAVDVQRRGTILARRMGIATRHISRALEKRFEGTRPGHTNAELAAQAIAHALEQAGARASDLTYLIAHTATPGELVPPNVVQVARLLDYDGPFVELRQACTGFANALVLANGILANGASGLVAVVGSETGSVYFDPLAVRHDKGQLVNLVQMGDGAAALVIGARDDTSRGLTHVFFGNAANRQPPAFRLVGGGSDAPAAGLPQFEHEFMRVRSHGPVLFERGAAAALLMGIDLRKVDYVIPHQVNGHMAALVERQLNIPARSVFVNADRLGNTGSAAMWLAFAELHARLKRGETVLALGAEATGHMFGGFCYVHG